MNKAKPAPEPVEEEDIPKDEPKRVPTYGSLQWIHYWSDQQGYLPSPINVSITGSLRYACPPLRWINFDVYPHKVKITNTGYTLLLGAKWKCERPYLEGGIFLEKHIFSQIHFHWGANHMEGSDHAVDQRKYPAEMQVTFFRSEYLTQEEALRHEDGVCVICYLIKYAVDPDPRLAWIMEGFPKVWEAQKSKGVGPLPMSHLLPMFYEDYFVYWGALDTVHGETFAVRWLVPRVTLYASHDQIKSFRTLCDPWDVPNLRNFRPLQDAQNRIVFLINAHWNLYNSLLPLPRVLEPSISQFSQAYLTERWMFPEKNSNMWPRDYDPKEELKKKWAIRNAKDEALQRSNEFKEKIATKRALSIMEFLS